MPSRFLLSDFFPSSDDPDISPSARKKVCVIELVGGVILMFLFICWVIKTVRGLSRQQEGAGNPVNPQPGVDAGNRPANPRQEAPPVRGHPHRSPPPRPRPPPPPPPPQQPARAVDGLPFLKFSDKTRSLVGAAEEGCVICLSEFESGEDLIVLPICSHGFHVMCIEEWWKDFHSCPTCRTMY